VTHRILVVEDEKDLLDLLSYNLSREGYSVDVATTGTLALERIRERKPDLVLLDLMLPDVPGTDVCRRVKGDPLTSHIPVVMVTARSEEIDRIVGFELGADDYVTKPFSVRELLLRVKAILRRDRAGAPAAAGGPLKNGRIAIDPERHRAEVDGREVALTALEFRLLACLLERAGRVQSRDVLLSDVWGLDSEVETRTVDAHVKRLRRKLGAAGDAVETVRGVGYRLREEPA
jgi:two-component system phosphate regulon response regulator PhoB